MAYYPDSKELELIKTWPYTDYKRFISFLQDNFWMSDWCINVKGKKVLSVWISTGGWSGNEDRMIALNENYLFWATCWIWSRRGGHYFFKIKLNRK